MHASGRAGDWAAMAELDRNAVSEQETGRTKGTKAEMGGGGGGREENEFVERLSDINNTNRREAVSSKHLQRPPCRHRPYPFCPCPFVLGRPSCWSILRLTTTTMIFAQKRCRRPAVRTEASTVAWSACRTPLPTVACAPPPPAQQPTGTDAPDRMRGQASAARRPGACT